MTSRAISHKLPSLTPELANLHFLSEPSLNMPSNSCLISTEKLLKSEDFKVYLATIYGEAGVASSDSWRAIANVINNRVGYKEWSRYKTQIDVIKYTRFDAYWQKTGPYTYAYNSLSSRRLDEKLNEMVSVVAPVYLHLVPDPTNGAVLYYSPKAQTTLAIKYPQQYKPVPKWNWDELQRLYPKGVKNDDFAFYKYQ